MAEAEIKAKPAAEQVIDGKPFVTYEEYYAQLAHIRRTTPKAKVDDAVKQYNDSVSNVSIDDIESQIVKHYAAEAKKVISDIDLAAQKKYKPAAPAVQPATTPTPVAVQFGNGKPKSPSVSSASDAVTTGAVGDPAAKNLVKEAVKSMFG